MTQELTTPHAGAVGMTARRHEDRAMTLGDDAPRAVPSSTTLLPHGLFAPRRTLPLGLDNAATSLARTICPNAQTYVERPMVLPRDVGARQQAADLPDFSQMRGLRRLGPGRYTITSLRQRLRAEACGCFYAAEPDSDSESDSYDPTRECFNIDGCGGINPYTLTARLGPEGSAHHEIVRGLIQLLGVSRKETRRRDQAGF